MKPCHEVLPQHLAGDVGRRVKPMILSVFYRVLSWLK